MLAIHIIILTKSYKNGGYCVAGIDPDTGRWIRLVTDTEDKELHGGIPKSDMDFARGHSIQPLDLVSVPYLKDFPSRTQPENVLIGRGPWIKEGRMTLDKILTLHPVETHRFLLGNQYHYITDMKIDSVGHSLILVQVDDMMIEYIAGHTPKASFFYHGDQYTNISVTDPDYYTKKKNCSVMVGPAYLVMSLPNVPFPSYKYYKFIAKIFPIRRDTDPS